MLLKSNAMASRDYLTSKSNINAHKLINVVDLIKKVKLEEKKRKKAYSSACSISSVRFSGFWLYDILLNFYKLT